MSAKVSVIVPVYNPGKYIEPCIASLLGQTLPPDELELLFVDDGSTDDTPARLDKLAAEHAQVNVVHIPNSGWPGKPRNIGVDEATGEYVHFVDQDDYHGARRPAPTVGHGPPQRRRTSSSARSPATSAPSRTASSGSTARSAPSTTRPLVDSLTPHKMFRTDFLRENKIAYPEGKRRLEDQLARWSRTSRPRCLHPRRLHLLPLLQARRRQERRLREIVPSGYYGEPARSPRRRRSPTPSRASSANDLLRRFYRVEMLGRVSEPSVLKYTPEYLRREVLDAVNGVADELHQRRRPRRPRRASCGSAPPFSAATGASSSPESPAGPPRSRAPPGWRTCAGTRLDRRSPSPPAWFGGTTGAPLALLRRGDRYSCTPSSTGTFWTTAN